MSTGPAWNMSIPGRPTADFDINATRTIPFEWHLWLAELGAVYQSHEIIAPPPLECVDGGLHVGGTVTALIRVADPSAVRLGRSYPVTCRLVTQDGQSDDTTVWLRMVDR